MCGHSFGGDRLLALVEAGALADVLTRTYLGLRLQKALELGTARGFDQAVAVLAARLRRAASRADADALRAALQTLDVDWARTTAAERRRVVTAALAAAGRATAIVPAQIHTPLGEAADEVIAATRAHARRRQRLAIGADLNALDQRIAAHVVRSQGNFVRDAYGRRLDAFGNTARAVVADGLARGLGRADLAHELAVAARAALVDRSPFYWEVVAGAFIGRGRAFAQASAYAEAGIRRYQIEAVLDERTTNVCRWLHGKTFTVADALAQFERVERATRPEDVKALQPWVRERRDPRTGHTRLYVDSATGRLEFADVERSARGRRDAQGAIRPLVSDTALRDAGLGFPPYHSLCRSTTLAVI